MPTLGHQKEMSKFTRNEIPARLKGKAAGKTTPADVLCKGVMTVVALLAIPVCIGTLVMAFFI